ncbi:MAG: dipeptidase, partial [Caldilineaceae bacterium]
MVDVTYPAVFDGHNDTVLDLMSSDPERGRSFFDESPRGHIDLPRIKKGGFGGGIFAIFTPSPKRIGPPPKRNEYAVKLPEPLKYGPSLEHAMRAFATLLDVEREADGAVKVVRTADELQACFANDTVAMVLHLEGAEPIDTDLAALEVFYAAGLRSLGPVWSRPTAFANGVPFAFPSSPDTGPGLTDAGKRLVKACNGLGIMLDLSHMNERGFWDVAELSDAPLVASHSGAHALCQSTRNLTDRQMDAIRETGGIAGVNFHIGFLRADGRSDKETSLDEIVRHVDYMVERMGIDHVGFGSDFDGATMPHDLVDVAGLPKLMAALIARG